MWSSKKMILLFWAEGRLVLDEEGKKEAEESVQRCVTGDVRSKYIKPIASPKRTLHAKLEGKVGERVGVVNVS